MKHNTEKYKNETREAFKTLRTNIDFAGIDTPIRSVTITSAKKGEGKSTIASNLAIVEAERHKKTLLIDNDFRNPQQARTFGVRSAHKLSEILDATSENFMDFCLPTKFRDLYVLDIASRRLSNPVDLLASQKNKHLIELANEFFDFVVIDTPPLELFIDAAIVAPLTDGVILAVGSGMTTAAEERDVLGQLKKAQANVLGAVLNGVKNGRKNDYYYYSKKKSGRKRLK